MRSKMSFITAPTLAALCGLAWAQSTTVTVPAHTVNVQPPPLTVPAITPPAVVLTAPDGTKYPIQPPPISAQSITPPVVAYQESAYTIQVNQTPPPPPPAPTSVVIGPAGAPASCTDASGNVWTDVGGVMMQNGTAAGYSAGVKVAACTPTAVYQQAPADCSWWSWNGTTWIKSTSTPTGVTLPKCVAPDTAVGVGTTGGAPPTAKFGIKISGSKFASTMDGKQVQIIGGSVSGLETGMNWRFASFANAGTATWAKMLNFNGSGLNTVRFPLNEASWLNYTCYDSGTGASDGHYTANGSGGYTPDPTGVYQATVKKAVADATAAGLYVILDLHWSAPNNTKGQPLCPNGQAPFADADHSVTFWTQIADAFKNNPAVIFELFNEPFGSNIYNSWVAQIGSSFSPGPDALVMAKGGSFSPLILQDNNTGQLNTINQTWNVAGMLSLLSAIRSTGAPNVVLASPIGWAGEIETWLGTYTANGNPDPLKQFGVAWHVYGYAKGVSYPQAILSANYPIAITEYYGFDSAFDGSVNTSGYAWAKQNDVGFVCWGVTNDWGGQALDPNSTPPFASCPAP